MSDVPANSPDAASRFFKKYLSCLAKAGVPVKRRRWYVKHIEYFIRAQNGRRIKTLAAVDINHYFDVLGRQNQLKSWQFSQYVNALQILYYELFALPVCKNMD